MPQIRFVGHFLLVAPPPGVACLSDAIWAEVVVRIPHQQQFLSVMYA